MDIPCLGDFQELIRSLQLTAMLKINDEQDLYAPVVKLSSPCGFKTEMIRMKTFLKMLIHMGT